MPYTYTSGRLGIYVHIPFCKSKCAYCDFNSAPPSSEDVTARYVDALIAHMESYRAAASTYAIDTVFIGGGTPTALAPELLFKLVKAMRRIFKLTPDAEFSIECNPATATEATLRKLRFLGVNRISFGLQSAHENELKALSRCHTRKDFAASFRMARDAGFTNINVDLMFGIPYQTRQSLEHSLYYVCGLAPEHISLYNLKIEPRTPFGQHYDEIRPTLPDEDTEADMYLDAVRYLADRGYRQYEISNFSRVGKECRHNLKYWNCDEYLGFGVSAHSYFAGYRFAMTPSIEDYITGVTVPDSKVRLLTENEEIDGRERMGEFIMLHLRLAKGLDCREFERRFGVSFAERFGDKCRIFLRGGFMVAKNGRVFLTPKGMFVSNYILTEILDFPELGHYNF